MSLFYDMRFWPAEDLGKYQKTCGKEVGVAHDGLDSKSV